MAKKKRDRVGERLVPIKRYVPEDMEPHYSDDILIQHTEHVFFLNFQQIQRPFAITQAEIAQIREVRAKCVARIVFTPAQMKVTVEALKSNFDKYVKKYGDVKLDASELEAMEVIAADTEGDETRERESHADSAESEE